MSSPTSHPPSISARGLYLLQQRAETFRVELELESQLRLQGIATLPIEWSAYLEDQRQMILDQIRIAQEPRENDFASSLGMAHDAHPTHNLPPTPPPLGPTTPPTRPEPGTVHRLMQVQPSSAKMVHPLPKHIHFLIPSLRLYTVVTQTPPHPLMSVFANPLRVRWDPYLLITKLHVVTIHFEMRARTAVRIRGG